MKCWKLAGDIKLEDRTDWRGGGGGGAVIEEKLFHFLDVIEVSICTEQRHCCHDD